MTSQLSYAPNIPRNVNTTADGMTAVHIGTGIKHPINMLFHKIDETAWLMPSAIGMQKEPRPAVTQSTFKEYKDCKEHPHIRALSHPRWYETYVDKISDPTYIQTKEVSTCLLCASCSRPGLVEHAGDDCEPEARKTDRYGERHLQVDSSVY